MISFHTFSNHVGGLTAQTVQAGTHRFRTLISVIGERDIASVPSKRIVSNPFAFSARRCNPDTGLTSVMNDGKSPLRIEFYNLVVPNKIRMQGVNDFDTVRLQDKFGSYPNQISTHCKEQTAQEFKKSLRNTVDKDQIGSRKEENQNQRGSSPDVITFGSKNFIHVLSIAGVTS